MDAEKSNQLINDALERHVTMIPQLSHAFPAGSSYRVFTTDRLVSIPTLDIGVKAGLFCADFDTQDIKVYAFHLSAIRDLEETIDEDDPSVVKAAEMKVDFQQIPIMGREDRQLTMMELLSWYAISDRETRQGRLEVLDAVASTDDPGGLLDALESAEKELAERTVTEKSQQIEGDAAAPRIIQDTKKVRTQCIPITKLSQSLGDSILYDGDIEIDVGGNAATYVSISYELDKNINISQPITPYDRDVNNAITSLAKAGNRVITLKQIYTQLTGSHSKPSNTALMELERSIDKQRHTYVRIDYSEQMHDRDVILEGETVAQYIREDHMVSAAKESITTANGKKAVGYVLGNIPILYQYAHSVGQVVTYPLHLLTVTNEAGSNTRENIVIKSYLLQRIEQSKNPNNKMKKRIKYSTVYKKAGLNNLDKKGRYQKSTYIKAVLKTLIDAEYIKGYTEYKAPDGKSLDGIEIEI